MTATADQIAQLRRMTAEPTETTYTDETMQAYIERYPCVDELGEPPRVPSTTVYNAMMDNPDWTATYDLHLAAAAIWEEKAATVQSKFDFSADGGDYSRSQLFLNAMRNARYHRSCRNPKSIILTPGTLRDQTYETNRA